MRIGRTDERCGRSNIRAAHAGSRNGMPAPNRVQGTPPCRRFRSFPRSSRVRRSPVQSRPSLLLLLLDPALNGTASRRYLLEHLRRYSKKKITKKKGQREVPAVRMICRRRRNIPRRQPASGLVISLSSPPHVSLFPAVRVYAMPVIVNFRRKLLCKKKQWN
jgi:hypothetical protein